MKALRDRCVSFNLDVEDTLRSGRIPFIILAKLDVDDFLNNVKWSLSNRAMDWWLAQISLLFGRKRYFVIPKDNSERELSNPRSG